MQRVDFVDVESIVAELRARNPDDTRLGIAKDESIHGVLGQVDQTFGVQTFTRARRRKPRTCFTW